MRIFGLRTEYAENPLGLDTPSPRFSWQLESGRNHDVQRAYQVLVASQPGLLREGAADLWDSGRVESGHSAHVIYQGASLESRRHYYWKVRVWDGEGEASGWSRSAHWSTGFLNGESWTAGWIGRKQPEMEDAAAHTLPPVPYLRRAFRVQGPVRRAMLYATALGVYEVHLNGERIGSDYLSPGWTDYHTRVQYQAYDVTEHLTPGEAVLGALLGTGWYAGHVGMFGAHRYGTNPYLLLELHVELEDGSRQVVTTDGSWKVSTGGILYSDLLKGEAYDARLEPAGWKLPGYDDGDWDVPAVLERYPGALTAQVDPPVRVMGELLPVSMKKTARGTYLYDMGQNMVGWVQLRLEESREGQEVTVGCAEMLNEDGSLYTTNLREAVQEERYILQGDGSCELEPHFTFHGFRYVEVSGLTASPTLHTVVGRVVHSAVPDTGSLETSDPRLNKLLANIRWGQRGNFLSVPTDCPQRDERLGWTGDAQIFARTASYQMDVARFFHKYMLDVIDARLPSGAFPDVAPDAGWEAFKHASQELNWHAPDNGGWGDAGVIIPWTVYQMYGDQCILEACLPAMMQWVDYLERHSPGLIRPGYSNYGDWLSIGADTPKDVLDTAYFAYSTALTAKSAGVLGRDEEQRKYSGLFQRIRQAFLDAFVSEDGRILGGTQTVYAVALQMNLLEGELRTKAAGHLAADVKAHGNRLTTGFLGVGYLLPALSGNGHEDTAYALLTQEAFPSWLYSVKHGATTIWERWDAWTESGGFQNPGMNSFNHYSLGSVGEWMYANLLGLRPAEAHPGFKQFEIRPLPGGGLTYAKGEFQSVYGTIRIGWKLERSLFTLQVEIPVNTAADIYLPGIALPDEGAEGEGARFIASGVEGTVYKAGSGSYTFVSRLTTPGGAAHAELQAGSAGEEIGA
ncbi:MULTISPECIES: glycoside hydrolase family 78 protein [Paenibacillus]|uniref:glycoside hydrolase family 78 protein n=1 Tax=Paenibacillus TaxID=44249 RepID=UPI0022B899CD|nr:glycoside hydrolase family 78 protein [Paenibacillus caseinilyticus]MCZ8519544.1 glycoside hydrolase family 78 protein [Paenibacillus caseinilyticus]